MNELVAAWDERNPTNPFEKGWKGITCLGDLMQLLSSAVKQWYVKPVDLTANHSGFSRYTSSTVNSTLGYSVNWSLPSPCDDAAWLAAAKQMRDVLNLMTFTFLSISEYDWVDGVSADYRSDPYDSGGGTSVHPAYDAAAILTGWNQSLETFESGGDVPEIYIYKVLAGPPSIQLRCIFNRGRLLKKTGLAAGVLYAYGTPRDNGSRHTHMPEVFFGADICAKFDLPDCYEATLLAFEAVPQGEYRIDVVKPDAVPVLPDDIQPNNKNTFGFEFDPEVYVDYNFAFHN